MEPRFMLSLDGGGIRGLSMLLILQAMMQRINPQNPPKPCEVFDLIGGTSTGGLIAVMLGRLEMDVQSAINAYLTLSGAIFKPRRKAFNVVSRLSDAVRAQARFDAARLEQCIKEMVKERLGDENAPLLSKAGESRCRVFVCAIRRENTQPVFLRSYHSDRGHEVPCTIWEACRATAAAVSIFEPVRIGPFKEEFVDGATGFNNPVNEVLMEGRDLWPETITPQNVGCLVSIGTGLRPNSSFGASAVQAGRVLLRIALETEKTAERFHRAFPTLVSLNKYFRFNVPKGLENIGLSEHDKINVLAAATRAYLHLESSQIHLRGATITLASRLASAGEDMKPPILRNLRTSSSAPDFSKSTPVGPIVTPTVSAEEPNILDHNEEAVSARDLQTFDSVQSWVKSFRAEPKGSGQTPTGNALSDEARLAAIKKLVRQKGPVSNVGKDTTPDSRAEECFRTCQRVPPECHHLVRRGVSADKLHIIVQYQGPAGLEIIDKLLPADAKVNDLIEYLEEQGSGAGVSGFRISASPGKSFTVPRMTKTEACVGVAVTAGASSHQLKDGYRINEDERLIDFYNARFPSDKTKPRVSVLAHADCIELRDGHVWERNRVHERELKRNRVYVDFKRTVRVPEDGVTYEQPKPQASLPLLPVKLFTSTLPPPLVAKGGLFFPMMQREAFVLGFSGTPGDDDRVFAIRVYTGAVNAVSGEQVMGKHPCFPGGKGKHTKSQDYVVAPRQKLLSGFQTGDGNLVHQFVAMPMGDGYTVEKQVSGEETLGGIQLEVIPRLRETAQFTRIAPPAAPAVDQNTSMHPAKSATRPSSGVLDMYSTPRAMGLTPGQRIFLSDGQPGRVYEDYCKKKYQPGGNVVEPEGWESQYSHRPTFIRELFDGPDFAGLDVTSSLVVSAIRPVQMFMIPQLSGMEHSRLLFDVSPFARMGDIRNGLRHRFSFQISSNSGITIELDGRKFGPKDDSLVADLGLEGRGPYRLGAVSNPGGGWYLGCGQGGDRSSSPSKAGWDMGLAMGGRVSQELASDGGIDLWDWRSARVINVQIINAAAFPAVTGGLYPPVSPVQFVRHHLVQSVTAVSFSSSSSSSGSRHQNPLARVKSVNELDWERGTALSVVLADDNKIPICVCCEASICDSIMDSCGHLFCRRCIAYYMSENGAVTCAFCSATAKRVVRISARAALPTRPLSRCRTLSSSVADASPRPSDSGSCSDEKDIAEDGIQLKAWQGNELATAVKMATAGRTWPLYESIKAGRGSGAPDDGGGTGILSLLLGQVLAQAGNNSTLLAALDIGFLVSTALTARNAPACRALVPLFEVVGHPGLTFARDHELCVQSVIDELGRRGLHKLDECMREVGLLKMRLLAGLGVFDFPINNQAGHRDLRLAARGDEVDMVRLMLALGADPEAPDKDGETALHVATSARVATLLCDAGANVAARDGDGNTTIAKAAAHAKKEVLKVLLAQEGAKEALDLRNKFGKLAVHHVTGGRNPDILTMLVAAGADPALPVVKPVEEIQ